MKSYTLSIGLLLCACMSYAQISKEGKLDSLLDSTPNLFSGRVNQEIIILKRINNDLELQRADEAAKECPSCKKDFYGTGIDTEIDIKEKGTKYNLGEGTLWKLTIQSTGAFAMQFYFTQYKVPEGGELYFTNSSGTMKLGAFGSHNNNENDKFATQSIKGDQIIVNYFEPKDVSFSGELKITKVIHAFKNIYKSGGFGGSESCNININCSEGSSYQDVKKAIARVSIYTPENNLAGYCSGALLNTTSNSKKPYFLTAYHCLNGTSDNQWQWIFEFNFELFICNGTVEPSTNSVQGAEILTKGKLSDYALLSLLYIPGAYNVLYLGWDSRDVVPTKTVVIHHPEGDVKKISIDTSPPVLVKTAYTDPLRPNWFEEVSGSPKSEFKVSWNTGITEGGSSGSPLINQDKRVIGQLHGGSSTCSAPTNPDYFGRLAISMNNPDAGQAPLKQFLDDNNTAATNWASLDPLQTTEETFKVNSIEITSNHWEDDPHLFGRISYNGNVQDLTYSWSPAADFLDPHAPVGLLYFQGQKPTLPLTKQYSLTVTTPGGLIRNQIITVTIYDCKNKEIYLDLCSRNNSEIGFVGGTNETYTWSPSANLSGSSISNPVFSPPSVGTFNYSLVASSNGCTRTENYHLTVVDFPTLPSFTPDIINQNAFITDFKATHGIKTSDGKFLLVTINKADPYYNDGDLQIVKLDTDLTVIWSKRVGNHSSYQFPKLIEVSGGYIIMAATGSSSNSYSRWISMVKVNYDGSELWNRTYEPATSQEQYKPFDILKLSDGDFVVVGNYEKSTSTVSQMAFLFRFDSEGVKKYSKFISRMVSGFPVNYTVNSCTINNADEIFIIGSGVFIKMNPNGSLAYMKNHTLDAPTNMIWGHDGSLIGLSRGVNNVTGTTDIKMIKFDINATLIWTKYFGGSLDEGNYYNSILRTSDGGFLLGTKSNSPADGSKSQPAWNSSEDLWIVKTDNDGNKLGDVRYGGTDYENLETIIDAGDGNYVVVGNSKSGISGDRILNKTASFSDAWVLKIRDSDSPTANPNPQTLEICEVFSGTFDNLTTPFKNEQVIIGGCGTLTSFEYGSKTSVRASQQLIIKPDTHIKSGSNFYGRIGSVNLSPCDVNYIMNSSVNMSSDILDVKVLNEDELSIFENSLENKIQFYPNPSTGSVNMTLKLVKDSDVSLTVSNALGKVVFKRSYVNVGSVNEILDFQELTNGIYSYSLRFSNRSENGKFVIAK